MKTLRRYHRFIPCKRSLRRAAGWLVVILITCLVYRCIFFESSESLEDYVQRYDKLSSSGSNTTPYNDYVVPNIVHYIRFNQVNIKFVEYLCIRAVYLNQRPDFIIFHTNVADFNGSYWERIKQEKDFYSRIRLVHLEPITHVFDQKLSERFWLWHASDVQRIQTVQKYGGIFLDNDLYVVQSLDYYRKFETVIGLETEGVVGNQVIIANRNSRFLPHWLDTYKVYKDEWYYNGGIRPAELLNTVPELAHVVRDKFGLSAKMAERLYHFFWQHWRQNVMIHLVYNHRRYLDFLYEDFPELNETNIDDYPHTARVIFKEALPADLLATSNSNSHDPIY